MQHAIRQALTERQERKVAGIGIYQRHTEQQERRGNGGQNRVLDAGFQRTFLAEGVADQAEQRQRNQFDTEEQRRQMVSARQQNAAQRGDQHQQIELFFIVLVTLKPWVGESTGGEARQQHQPGVEHRIAVYANHRRDVHRSVLTHEPE